MYVVTLGENVWLHITPTLSAAKRVQKRIRKCGFWFQRKDNDLMCSYKKFRGASNFAEFFQEDIIIQWEENQ